MVKEKRILSYILGWFIVGFIIIFMGIKKTYASEITSFDFLNKDFNSFWINENSSINGNLSVYVSDITQIKPYINIIIAGTSEPSFDVTLNNYFSDTWTKKLYTSSLTKIDNYTANIYVIQFSTKGLNNWNCSTQGTNCYVNTNLRMYNKASYSSAYQLRSITLTDLILDDDYLKNITINQNNEIIDQNQTIIDQNQSIISGQDKIEDAIVDSNKETQEVIKDQFNTCRPSVNLFSFNNYSQPQADTTIEIINSNKGIVKLTTNARYHYINVFINGLEKNTNYTFNGKFINSNENMKNLWFGVADNPTTTVLYNNSYSSGTDVTFNTGNATAIIIYLYASGSIEGPNEATWYDIQLQKGDTSTTFEPYGEEICSNKIDDTNDKLNGIQEALTDSSAPNTSGLENSAGWLPAGPLDSILNLPLSMLNSLTNSLGKTCAPLNLTLPYVNKNIEIPCLSTIFSKITGVNGLWTWVGTIASVLILYNYLLNLYAWVDRVLTLRAEFDEAMGADMANWGRL